MRTVVKLLADKQILLTEDKLPESVLITRFDPSEGIPDDVGDFDALFVRTVSPIDFTTIPGNPKRLRFIGSATAGFDHVDLGWLDRCNIEFAYAPGCNASSVGEYVAVSILAWAFKTDTDLSSLMVGIIGAGQTGTAAANLLDKLGIAYKSYDPPRQATDVSYSSVGLNEILNCDILTFHTPLTTSEEWPTKHWLNKKKLGDRRFRLIINAARGGVIDEKALYTAFMNGNVHSYILDVWENEPYFDDQIAENAWLRTPHIAGYSIQSKQRAAKMLLKSFNKTFGFKDRSENSAEDRPRQIIADPESDLLHVLLNLNPIAEYDRMFKDLIGLKPERKPQAFQEIRTSFPLRHEHPYYKLEPETLEKFPVLIALGFSSK